MAKEGATMGDGVLVSDAEIRYELATQLKKIFNFVPIFEVFMAFRKSCPYMFLVHPTIVLYLCRSFGPSISDQPDFLVFLEWSIKTTRTFCGGFTHGKEKNIKKY